jgi:Zn-finger nucleic acid-binding protein
MPKQHPVAMRKRHVVPSLRDARVAPSPAMQCPKCKRDLDEAGRTFRCESCDGAWVREEVLVAMLEQSANELVSLAWKPNTEDHVRACPECETAMQTVALGDVALDRCDKHGVWFDARELAALLGQSKQFRSEPVHHEGLLSRLAKLFH